MVQRLLAALLALAITVLALGGLERQPHPGTLQAQALGQTHEGAPGSIEDHHLDDMPAQSADVLKTEPMLPSWSGASPSTLLLGAAWTPQVVQQGPLDPYPEGPLRPPRLSA